MRFVVPLIFLALTLRTAGAVALDECEQQRAQYPKNWNDVSKEKGVFDCNSHYAGAMRVKIGPRDSGGRTLISLVALKRTNDGVVEDTTRTVYRIWLDREQMQRLQDGKYFATIVRSEKSCWIRGDLEEDSIFFMDNASPPSDGLREGAGSFYNKAPRFGVFQDNAYACEATK